MLFHFDESMQNLPSKRADGQADIVEHTSGHWQALGDACASGDALKVLACKGLLMSTYK